MHDARSETSPTPSPRHAVPPSHHRTREHRRRRFRRHRRRAYIRSIYFLPSLATLGNAVCGFAAMYVATLAFAALASGNGEIPLGDRWTEWWARKGFTAAAYLIFLSMVFDAIDGRLARFTRHTTDFGGQLDSLADVVSFGAAPAFIALLLFRVEVLGDPDSSVPVFLARLNWAIGALYFSCAAMRLARFNVSNEHGEQHHFSFLGLPSPGAGGAVAAWILMQQDLRHLGTALGGDYALARQLADVCIYIVPVIVLSTGLLMVSNIRYPHLVNRYLRGRRSLAQLLFVVVLLLLLVVYHQYTLGIGMLAYAFYGFVNWFFSRMRKAAPSAPPSAPPPAPPPPSLSPPTAST